MIENHNSPKAPFSNKDVINALSWMEKLVAENGTRLTGTIGFKKAYEIICQRLKKICHVVNSQKFTHHRESFLSAPKLPTASLLK
tara:strand:- start:232 stop:486 length:255 start_codon:yes stop_codon:yes gene_type:complete